MAFTSVSVEHPEHDGRLLLSVPLWFLVSGVAAISIGFNTGDAGQRSADQYLVNECMCVSHIMMLFRQANLERHTYVPDPCGLGFQDRVS